jgi:hypothetical protein
VCFERIKNNTSQNEQDAPGSENLRKAVKTVIYLSPLFFWFIWFRTKTPVASIGYRIVRATKGYPNPDNCCNPQNNFLFFGLVQKWLILGNSSERMSTIAKDWQ